MTFQCRRATLLVSCAMDRRLSFSERVGLRFHLLICACCRRFRRQMIVLRLVLRRRALPTAENDHAFMLHPQARARIQSALEAIH